jgi:putative Holliday junction resolvase
VARILGVDYGLRRIGFAASDDDEVIAFPLFKREVKSIAEAVAAVADVCEEERAQRVVLGLPLNMDGSAGAIVEQVLALRKSLQARVDVPVETWDERLTSKSAEDVLIQAGTRRKRRREVIDKLAAQIMLQSYLDARGGGGVEENMDPWGDGPA